MTQVPSPNAQAVIVRFAAASLQFDCGKFFRVRPSDYEQRANDRIKLDRTPKESASSRLAVHAVQDVPDEPVVRRPRT